MSASEKLPLMSSISRDDDDDEDLQTKSDAYLLLSVPQTDKTFVQKLSKLGKYSGIIVGTSVAAIILIIIVAVTYHADITEINRGGHSGHKKPPLSATAGESLGSESDRSRIVTTPLGKLKGYIRKSRAGRDFLAFYKVPYAKPPIKELRFKDPQPVEAWEGTWEEAEVAPRCIQRSKKAVNGVAGEEDCLYSNIYVPINTEVNNEISNYPTMVYIHGGGFDIGDAGRYGAEYFMDEDVVLITFEYRLGLLGFLNTGDREAAGNMGLKDQVMLLKWIQSYISYLGGDPSRVTLFGNSIGSTAASFLAISPMAKNLFHRAIAQSGTAFCETTTFTIDLQPEVTKKAVAKNFNCSLSTSLELLECLRAQSASDLATFSGPNTKYGLTIEKALDPNDLSNVFMPEQPYQLLQSGKVNHVPYMIGVMATEMIAASLKLLSDPSAIKALNANFSTFLPEFGLDLTVEESQSIKSFYFGDNTVGNHTERNLTNLISDCIFVHCSKVFADMFSEHTETFLYYLSKNPKKSYAEKLLPDFPFIDRTEIVSHADEVQYLFPYSGFPEYPTTDTEYFPFSQFLVKLWAHFATTGNPVMNPNMESWKAISTHQKPRIWFELSDTLGLTTVLEERMNFMDGFSHKQLTYELPPFPVSTLSLMSYLKILLWRKAVSCLLCFHCSSLTQLSPPHETSTDARQNGMDEKGNKDMSFFKAAFFLSSAGCYAGAPLSIALLAASILRILNPIKYVWELH